MHSVMAHINWLFHCNPFRIKPPLFIVGPHTSSPDWPSPEHVFKPFIDSFSGFSDFLHELPQYSVFSKWLPIKIHNSPFISRKQFDVCHQILVTLWSKKEKKNNKKIHKLFMASILFFFYFLLSCCAHVLSINIFMSIDLTILTWCL